MIPLPDRRGKNNSGVISSLLLIRKS